MALRETKASLQNFLNTAATGLVRNSRDMHYISVNTEYGKIVGLPVDQIMGRSLADVIGEAALEKARPYIERVLAGERVEYEAELPFANTGPQWVHVIYTPDYNDEGEIVGWVGSVHNITQAKRHEREIERMNRLYAALSEINETIIRTSSREQLFQDVCRVAATTAGFKLAWVAQLDSKTQQMIPVGRFGEGHGYLDAIKVYGDDRPEGRGVVGTCIRSGQPSISNDLLFDKRFGPWQAHARKYGLRAAAGLPLRLNGKIWGAFTIYGDEPNVFQDKEIALLREAAADISFAMDQLEQQRLLRTLAAAVEHSPAIIVITDPAGKIEYVNPKFSKASGFGAEEVLGRNPRLLKSGETPREEYRKMWETISSGGDWRGEFHNRKKNGDLYWESASISSITDGDGKITNYLAVKEDITERKRAQEALQESEAKWRSYMENAPVGILVADPSGKHVEANHAIEEMLGYPPGGLLGTKVQDLPANPGEAAVGAHFAELRQCGHAEGEFELRRKDGGTIWASVRALRLPGNLVMGVFQDITRSRQLEMELRQAQKLEAVARLAGGVAHDFNNILAAILMQLSLLQMKHDFDQETRETIDELDAAAQRGTAIARQLLMFSRGSAMSIRSLDLNQVFTNLLKMLQRLIGEDVTLHFDPGPGPHWVEADAGMMEQVLMNLVVNARDAMPNGGHIAVGVYAVHLGAAAVAKHPNRRAGQFVCLTALDTGTGMDAATMKRIFEPFFTTKEPGKGTGLGLATVYGIVAQHNGWIEVESQVGVGTNFHIYLPASKRPADQLPSPKTATPFAGGSETILLVEDDAAVRRTVAQTLRLLGYAVHEAGDGPAALELWKAKGPDADLLLTDMVMPNGINGLQLIDRLRALKPGLKALIFSGYSEEVLTGGAPVKEGVLYLSKPCAGSVLADTVRRALEQKS